MREHLFIFGLGGTLLDTKLGVVNSFRYAVHELEMYGMEPDPLESPNKLIGPPIRDSFRNFFCIQEEKLEEAVTYYNQFYVQTGIFQSSLYFGIKALLNELRDEGIKMAVATAKPRLYAKIIIELRELDEHFSFIRGPKLNAEHASKEKTIASILAEFENHKAFMVGDRYIDVKGALDCGITPIGALWGYGSREELAQAGCEIMFDSPLDLLEGLPNLLNGV